MQGSALGFGVVLLCGVSVIGLVLLAAVIVFALRHQKKRADGWLAAGTALGLRADRTRRTTEELGPGVSSLMRGAILLGGWNRLLGDRDGRAVELVLRGEVGKVVHAPTPNSTRSSTPVRTDFTHIRVARRSRQGFVSCSRGALENEVTKDEGPPNATIGDPHFDAALCLWAHDPGLASRVLGGVATVEAIRSAIQLGWMLCLNDLWVVLEVEEVVTDPVRLEAAIEHGVRLACALDGGDLRR